MALFGCILLLGALSWYADATRSDYRGYIQPYTYSNWGSWGYEDWCSYGSYAYGFSLKVEGSQGSGDDTALNGIQLYCRTYCGAHTHSVKSSVMRWGSWKSTKYCPAKYFLKGASVRSESPQGRGDDTAVNNFDFLCEHSDHSRHTQLLDGDGMSWGSWTTRKDCPSGSYMCGVKTKVEGAQRSGDDTALNDAIFYCCTLRKTTCLGYKD